MASQHEAALPQHDRNAEEAAIGAMLRDPLTIPDVSAIVRPDDFYSFANQRIFAAMLDMVADGKVIDPVTLGDEINSRGWMTDIGGASYLIHLWDSAPVTRHAEQYAKIVTDKSTLRRIGHAATQIVKDANDPGSDPRDVIARAESAIFDLSVRRDGARSAIDWRDALRRSLERLDRRAGRHPEETESAIMTGWPSLDAISGGIHRKELVILAARPSVGKTLAALNIIDHAAANNHRILLSSIEQGDEELVERLLAKHSGVSSYKFRTADFSAMDEVEIDRAAKSIEPYRIRVNSSSWQSVASITSDARRIAMRGGIDMVVIDYLQLIAPDGRSATRNEEIGRMTRGLKRLAKDLNVAVVCLAQLNRGSENRVDKRPRLSDLRDSGEIEQDADTVFMLHKPEEKDANRTIDRLQWLIEKQRNGPCGEVELNHHRTTFAIKEP